MEKKHPIVVRVNQDKHKEAVAKKLVVKHPMMEKEPHQTDYPVLSDGSQTNPKQLPRFIKMLLFAVVPAAAIGLLFGFIMLHLFSDMNTGNPPQQQAATSDSQATVAAKNPGKGVQIEGKQDSSTFTIPALRSFVLQGGIFSDAANAETITDHFKSAGYPTVIVRSAGQYYLLAGIAATNDKAKNMAKTMEKENLEVYAKEWSADDRKIKMTKNESQWITSFSKTFQTAVNSLSDHESIDQTQWVALQKKIPEKSSTLKDLGAVVSELAKTDNDTNDEQKLLEALKAYEEIGSSERFSAS